MKTIRPLTAILAATMVLTAVLTGCGKKSAPMPDTAPFQTAIEQYLAKNSMDLAVSEFRELTVENGSARAVVSLGHAEGATGVKVRWTFVFAAKGPGWIVQRHEQ